MPVAITNYNFGQAINFICQLVGYPTTQDPAGSQDPKHAQMRAALTEACAEMLALKEWQDLITDGAISVVADAAGQKEKGFALPVDFYRFIDQTQWADQQLWPAGGPVSPQAWRRFLVWATYPQMTLYWQIRGDQLWVLSPPFPTPQTFLFYYLSRAQVIDENDPTLRKNTLDKNGDQFVLDAYTIALLARKKWLEWNSMDSSAATSDFNMVFNSRAGADKGAPVLNISRSTEMPLLHPMMNTPATGFGGH
jgi:hypothetical protein